MTDDKGQETGSALRQLLFELPFVINRDGEYDASEWKKEEIDKFSDLIFRAGEEISNDQAPVNSPAGKYKKRKYQRLRDYLNQTAEEYTNTNSKHLIAQACEWVLRELGWLKDQANAEKYKTRKKRVERVEEIYREVENYTDAINQFNEEVGEIIYQDYESFKAARYKVLNKK